MSKNKKVVKVTVEPKSHNERVAEENAKRMKGISDVLVGSSDALINSMGDEVTKENMVVLNRFIDEMNEAKKGGNIRLITEKAEQICNGLLFAGMDSDEVRAGMTDTLEGFGVVLNDTPEDILAKAKIRYDEIMSRLEEARPV